MKTFYWLVKREFWEHRGGFLWAPVISAGAVVLINIMSIIAGEVVGGRHFNYSIIWTHVANGTPEQLKSAGALLDFTAAMPGIIVSIALFFVLFGYCMRTLSRDRSDRSILFWKSLPISDLNTVLSKVFSAVVMAPVIAVIASVIGACLIYLIFAITGAFHGVGFGELLWRLPHPGHVIVFIIALLPIYMIWMLPSVGWLLLCSAWAKGRVARWAIALPIAVGAIFTWLGIMQSMGHAAGWFWHHVVERILLGLLPGNWVLLGAPHGMQELLGASFKQGHWHYQSHVHGVTGALDQILGAQYQLLGTPQFLWGILAGAIMIALAIWLRRWRTEL